MVLNIGVVPLGPIEKPKFGGDDNMHLIKKSCIRQTPNLSTNADSSTNIFVSAEVKNRADRICFLHQHVPPLCAWSVLH